MFNVTRWSYLLLYLQTANPLQPKHGNFQSQINSSLIYQFTRILFKWPMGLLVSKEKCMNSLRNMSYRTHAYVDNLIICGNTTEKHDFNLQHFQKAVRLDNWTYNEEKSKFSVPDLLEYHISEGDHQAWSRMSRGSNRTTCTSKPEVLWTNHQNVCILYKVDQ